MFIGFYSIFLKLSEENRIDRLHFQEFQLVQRQLQHLFYSNQVQQEQGYYLVHYEIVLDLPLILIFMKQMN